MQFVNRPTCREECTVHPAIVQKVVRYASQASILHTTFCGPAGSGKYTLALLLIAEHMQTSMAALQRVHPHTYSVGDKDYTFYKSQHHFEIDVAHFQPHQQKAVVEIIRDLSKTMNVAINRYKIIVVRNSEHLTRGIQHQLRRIVETLYRTSRLVFICHNADNLDATIRSRFLELYVPSPSDDAVRDVVRRTCDATAIADAAHLDDAVLSSGGNLHLAVLHAYMAHMSVRDELTVLIDTLWQHIRASKNCALTIRKILRDVSVTQVPWQDIMHGLLARVYSDASAKLTPERIGAAVRTSCYYTYLHDISHRKEIQLELLVLNLHELMQHRPLVPVYRDVV